MKKELCLMGLNYKTAPVEIRERFALTDPVILEKGVIPIDGEIRECLILSTCNRVEVLTVAESTDSEKKLANYWAGAVGESTDTLESHAYIHKGSDVVKHLFTVAASLDSMVVGEPQILGQLKDAYRDALKNKSARVILSRLLHKSFSVAKRVRSETAVASSAVSVSYAAVELAKRIFGELDNTSAMLLGAGEMAELSATHLFNSGVKSITVVNRTEENARLLADRYKGKAATFDKLVDLLPDVDIVVCSTGAHDPVITVKDMHEVLKKRKNKPMFIIDIAVPRDVEGDVNKLDNVYLYDIDDLREVIEENMAHRKEEAVKAAGIVEEEAERFCRWLDALEMQPTLVEIIRKGERIAEEEAGKTLKKMGVLTEEQKDAVTSMAVSIIKKMHHDPITFLKENYIEGDYGNHLVNSMRKIFNLDNEKQLLFHKPDCTEEG